MTGKDEAGEWLEVEHDRQMTNVLKKSIKLALHPHMLSQ